MKLVEKRLKDGFVDEMSFEKGKCYLIHGSQSDFKNEFQEYLVHVLNQNGYKALICSQIPSFIEKLSLQENIEFLTGSIELHYFGKDSLKKLTQKPIQDYTIEEKLWIQCLGALNLCVDYIIFDHCFLEQTNCFHELCEWIKENHIDIGIINFSEQYHFDAQFDEIWQVKGERCLFIK